MKSAEEIKALAMAYITPPQNINRKIIRNPRTEALMTKEIIQTREGDVALRKWGEGPIVLLVHGWAANQIDLYNYVPPLVESGFTAVAMDLPAHGESAGTSTGLEQMGLAVAAAGKHLGPLKAAIAHSVGCAAMQVALTRDLEVERVVLLASPQNYEQSILEYAAGHGLSAEEGQAVLKALHDMDIRTKLNSQTMLRGIDKPILIVHSEDDAIIPSSKAHDLHAICPKSKLHLVTNLGHRGILKDAKIIEKVLNFITEEGADKS